MVLRRWDSQTTENDSEHYFWEEEEFALHVDVLNVQVIDKLDLVSTIQAYLKEDSPRGPSIAPVSYGGALIGCLEGADAHCAPGEWACGKLIPCVPPGLPRTTR